LQVRIPLKFTFTGTNRLGIIGLVTAKCLSNHAEKVILIERKQMRDTKQSVAAHGNIIHVLLTRGWDIISRLFPGIGTLKSKI
jgi:glycine/D-amino acid oxidase-like deaminating enzyme